MTDGMFWFSPARDVVRVHGADARTYLHSQLSQDVDALAVGDSAWSFVLAPNGRIDLRSCRQPYLAQAHRDPAKLGTAIPDD